ncbi:MAG: DUF262 domain-containing protein [Ginsengibacter sp.]
MNRMPSSSAQDRTISIWFQKIENGEIKLPRFQRPQAWDKNRICSLLDTVTNNLPLGVTLLLNVDEEQFVSRYLVTAPKTNSRVTEHLLDGQQRLTALWRSLHNNYEGAKYFLKIPKYDKYATGDSEDLDSNIFYTSRWVNKNGVTMPMWADKSSESFSRGLIPLDLFRPTDISNEYEDWVNEAILPEKPTSDSENFEAKLEAWMNLKNDIIKIIRDYRETISHFNLPFLALPTQTKKETALQVFINMNTNSKPLSQYDIIRAEIEGVKGISLDDYQNRLNSSNPNIQHYFELPFLILATSALMQDKLPNQRGMWDMKKNLVVENWDKMSIGLAKMAVFMESQGIYDKARLPTNAVLSVIAALYTYIPDSLDSRGAAETLIKKYLWSSFFTDRYENSAASSAYNDFIALKNILLNNAKENGINYSEKDVPVLDRQKYPLSTEDELAKVGWPKRENIRGRGILAVYSKLGAIDFADGTHLTRQQLIEGKRHYHHVFPDALLKEANIESFLALNCSLITDKTNLNISNKEPYRYLKERYNWTSEEIVHSRLKSHLIPISELKNGGYAELSETDKIEKIQTDFESFISKRAKYVVNAINRLAEGLDIHANDIINEVEKEEIILS